MIFRLISRLDQTWTQDLKLSQTSESLLSVKFPTKENIMTLYILYISFVRSLLNRLVNLFYFIAQCKKPSGLSAVINCPAVPRPRALTGSCIYQCISVSAHIKIFGQSLLMFTVHPHSLCLHYHYSG